MTSSAARRDWLMPVGQRCRRGIPLGLLALTWSSFASAYRTAGDLEGFADTATVRWPDTAVVYELSTSGLSSEDVVALEQTMGAAFSKWELVSCSSVKFEYRGGVSSRATAGDGSNTVEWILEGWEARGFAPSAAAVTDAAYARNAQSKWEIVEVDLYVNGVNFAWDLYGEGQAGSRAPASMLTHEAGHMLGLLHPCEEGGMSEAPDCAAVPESAASAMSPLYAADRIELTSDDEAGLCFLYPLGEGASGSSRPRVVGIGGVCDGTEQCPLGTACEGNTCKPGPGLAGDPCESGNSCSSRACTSEGYCARGCASDDDCLPSQACTALDSHGGVCAGDSPGNGLGVRCNDASECLGGECVERRDADRISCSRSCTEFECPDGWACEDVAGRDVCVQVLATPSGGCATVAREREPTRGFALVGLGFLALSSLAARRRWRKDATG
jgi:hypothetical protein